MSRIKEILEELRTLDLSTYPYQKVKALIEEIFYFHAMLYILPKGTPVLRARVNEGKSFREPKDLSYKPQKFNKLYQRASTPYQTAFYAGALPERTNSIDLRIITTLEASPLVRKAMANENIPLSNDIQIETLTFGKWEVFNDLPLVALCYHKEFIEKHTLTEDLYKKYCKLLNTLSEEQQEASILINDFFALEFAKEKITYDYEYVLSAVFTEVAVSLGHAGVLYPSVRCEGTGFNIAIYPEHANKHLRLVAAGESKIYYKDKNFFLNNDSFTLIKPGQKRFTFTSLKGRKLHTDERIIFAFLNKEIELPAKNKLV